MQVMMINLCWRKYIIAKNNFSFYICAHRFKRTPVYRRIDVKVSMGIW